MKVSLVVPTYNGGDLWKSCVKAIQQQSIKFDKILIIDSTSEDSTSDIAKAEHFSVIDISPEDFNHGETRNLAMSHCYDCDIVVFLTQDAILSSRDSVRNILMPFSDPLVAAVCGCQRPHDNANPLASHARYFNYPEISNVKSKIDIEKLGIKTVFMSNSFAAYRINIFRELGGFPKNVILAEDMYLAAKMIFAGYKVAYCAEASVKHSHNYSPWDEFQRYFDIGVFHANEPWIRETFGGTSGEGKKFVFSEMKHLFQNNPLWMPRAFLTILCKLIGYKLGIYHKYFPYKWNVFFSMYKSYWLRKF